MLILLFLKKLQLFNWILATVSNDTRIVADGQRTEKNVFLSMRLGELVEKAKSEKSGDMYSYVWQVLNKYE